MFQISAKNWGHLKPKKVLKYLSPLIGILCLDKLYRCRGVPTICLVGHATADALSRTTIVPWLADNYLENAWGWDAGPTQIKEQDNKKTHFLQVFLCALAPMTVSSSSKCYICHQCLLHTMDSQLLEDLETTEGCLLKSVSPDGRRSAGAKCAGIILLYHQDILMVQWYYSSKTAARSQVRILGSTSTY